MTTREAKPTDAALAQAITREVAKRVVGQEQMVERLLVGLLTGGHILLEGVPGLAKTLAVRTVAECLRINYSRIQFTPDLLPADVIGTMVFDQRSQEFYPKKGPLFARAGRTALPPWRRTPAPPSYPRNRAPTPRW